MGEGGDAAVEEEEGDSWVGNHQIPLGAGRERERARGEGVESSASALGLVAPTHAVTHARTTSPRSALLQNIFGFGGSGALVVIGGEAAM